MRVRACEHRESKILPFKLQMELFFPINDQRFTMEAWVVHCKINNN